MYNYSDWSILSASCLFQNRRKVSLLDIMGEWSEGSIVITRCRRKGTIRFISSCGHMDAPVGFVATARDDQTLRPFGDLEVVNVVRYRKGDDGKPVVSYLNTNYSEAKASPFVFK